MEKESQPSCEHCQSTDHTTKHHEQSDAVAAVWTTYLDVASSDDEEDQKFADDMIDDLE
jgi:hypothetical protein